jgi:hypothetical protein
MKPKRKNRDIEIILFLYGKDFMRFCFARSLKARKKEEDDDT